MNKLLLGVIIFVVGCSKQPTLNDDSNLKPVDGAFGLKLGETVPSQIEESLYQDALTLHDTPPFSLVTINRMTNGIVCQIVACGSVAEYQKDDTKKRLISVLSEKYGLREKVGSEKYEIVRDGEEIFYFGTTSRLAHLSINDWQTNVFFMLEYSDKQLAAKFYQEQEVIKRSDDELKKAAISKDL